MGMLVDYTELGKDKNAPRCLRVFIRLRWKNGRCERGLKTPHLVGFAKTGQSSVERNV